MFCSQFCKSNSGRTWLCSFSLMLAGLQHDLKARLGYKSNLAHSFTWQLMLVVSWNSARLSIRMLIHGLPNFRLMWPLAGLPQNKHSKRTRQKFLSVFWSSFRSHLAILPLHSIGYIRVSPDEEGTSFDVGPYLSMEGVFNTLQTCFKNNLPM